MKKVVGNYDHNCIERTGKTLGENPPAFALFEMNGNITRQLNRLNGLLDEVGDNENHQLYSLLDTLGTLIQVYEEEHVLMPDSSGVEVLHYLMEEHQLVQSNLTEVGSQGVVSEVLSGKRELNVRQIRELAKRFHVSPGVFI